MAKITDFINGKVSYDKEGQYFWVNDGISIQLLALLVAGAVN